MKLGCENTRRDGNEKTRRRRIRQVESLVSTEGRSAIELRESESGNEDRLELTGKAMVDMIAVRLNLLWSLSSVLDCINFLLPQCRTRPSTLHSSQNKSCHRKKA